MHEHATHLRAPGPRGQFLFGCLSEFRRDSIGLLQRSARDYGDVVKLRFGPMIVHLLNHPDHVEHVLVSNAHNFDKRTRSVAKIRATCGNSLLSSDGDAWKRHRQLIQPAFLRQNLQRYGPLMFSQIERTLERWHNANRAGQEIDIVSEMMHVTLRIAAGILFGADVDADTDIIERALGVVMRDTWRRLESALDMSVLTTRFHRPEFRRAVQQIDAVVNRIIDERRRRGTSSQDVLSLLLSAHQQEGARQFSNRELRDAVMTLLLSGHETTANALAWTFLLISQAPDVEQRLCDAARHCGAAGDAPVAAYPRMVFQEAIRLYPSVWIMERRVIDDDVFGGFAIPGGSTVLISPYLLHRHPQFWVAPEDFRPDRFADGGRAATLRHAYIPFGVGPHQCIGQQMALLVADAVLSSVYREFRLRLVPHQDVTPQPGITLQHAHGLRMSLQSLKRRPVPHVTA